MARRAEESLAKAITTFLISFDEAFMNSLK
jgi:hypothetical protein